MHNETTRTTCRASNSRIDPLPIQQKEIGPEIHLPPQPLSVTLGFGQRHPFGVLVLMLEPTMFCVCHGSVRKAEGSAMLYGVAREKLFSRTSPISPRSTGSPGSVLRPGA